jgi:hypothetical protein
MIIQWPIYCRRHCCYQAKRNTDYMLSKPVSRHNTAVAGESQQLSHSV